MPKPPLFASDGARRRAIAVLMLALLLVSLGAAYAISLREVRHIEDRFGDRVTTELGEIRVRVPRGWAPRADAERVRGLEHARVFQNPERDDQDLLIGTLRPTSLRTPQAALLQAEALVVGGGDDIGRYGRTVAFRAGTLVGARDTLIRQTKRGTQQFSIAVLTEDGRRYWVILQTERVKSDAGRQADAELFSAIISDPDTARFRDATDADWAAVEVPEPSDDLLVGFLPRAGAPASTSARLHLVPDDESPRLRLLRVRGTIDSGINAPAAAYAPRTLLAMQYEVPPDRISEQDLAGTPLLWATLSGDETANRGAVPVREIWYAPLDAGRALLVELICEPLELKPMRERLLVLVGGLRGPAAPAAATGGVEPAFGAAVQRGEALTAAIASGLEANLTPSDSDWLVEFDGQLQGYKDVTIETPLVGEPLPYRGKSVRYTPPMVVQQGWALSRDGRTFQHDWVQQLPEQIAAAGLPRAQVQRLALTGGKLRGALLVDGQSNETWTMPALPNYVPPPTQDLWWPADAISEEPALVWLSKGPRRPSLYSVQRRAPGDGETVVMTVRPVVGLDEDRYELASSGRVERADVHQEDGIVAHTVATYRRVDRAALLEAFPALKK